MPMKPNTTHEQYNAHAEFWMFARDTYAGEAAVKKRGETYLPKLGAHKLAGGADRYLMYLKRALFYNAVGRTVDGLAGAALRSDPQLEVPDHVEDDLRDVSLRDQPLELAAQLSTREILTTGRQGILIDINEEERPYWSFYAAEDIVNWRVEYVGGKPRLTLVVLHEVEEAIDPDDFFSVKCVDVYRALTLTEGVSAVTTWRKDASGNWLPDPPVMPQRRGASIDFIPFVFINPTGTKADVEKPPLLDLINVNLSHYRNSADLEHGLHFVGVPQIVIMGAPQTGNDPMEFGSSVVWVLDQGADAKILQADGETLGALERALDRKKKDMATLGARMLEDQATTQETATAVLSRSAGEHATLATIVNSVEQAYTRAVQIHAWWAKGNTEATPDDIEAKVELSKDFSAVRLSAQDVVALMGLLQAEAISFETFWTQLTAGQWGRPVSPEEELKEIAKGEENPYTPDPVPAQLQALGPDGKPVPDPRDPNQQKDDDDDPPAAE